MVSVRLRLTCNSAQAPVRVREYAQNAVPVYLTDTHHADIKHNRLSHNLQGMVRRRKPEFVVHNYSRTFRNSTLPLSRMLQCMISEYCWSSSRYYKNACCSAVTSRTVGRLRRSEVMRGADGCGNTGNGSFGLFREAFLELFRNPMHAKCKKLP